MDFKFKGQWRLYQQRVLDELNFHLDDKKLHVVAAPGSGKTILGLEALFRLGQNTLILTPTITIREQWITRFEEFYLPDDKDKDAFITNDLTSPKLLTVSTYQALHSAYKKLINKETSDDIGHEVIDFSKIDLIKELKQINIGTIVIDEAHHLRTEWWKSLTDVISKLGNIKIIALTATPPYDVSKYEWDKYQELCGMIDAEIYVPELVKARNLCPHQDYVYFNYPTDNELESINEFRHQVYKIVNELFKNESFINAIKDDKWIKEPKQYLEDILKDPEYYTSMLVFLNELGIKITKNKIKILGHCSNLPNLNYIWLEKLLNGFLYNHNENSDNEVLRKELKSTLKKHGCIERKKVYLKSTNKINKLLINSLGKLNSITEIVHSEYSNLKEALRMVILTDYIRQEILLKENDEMTPINMIGVVPIFETLRRNLNVSKLGVLSGSVIIIPKGSINKFHNILDSYNINSEQIKITELTHDENYCQVQFNGQSNKQKVNIISRLFSEGEINVLIGTKSLLGEGWDEPSINSLILASFVGSYMLSNQMRGRAIRIDKNNLNKTANIWHLVCIDRDDYYEGNILKKTYLKLEQAELYGNKIMNSEDFTTLKRRFNSFVGISYDGSVIENGIDRLNIIKPPFTKKHISEINKMMLKLSNQREDLSEKWFNILNDIDDFSQVTEIVEADKNLIPNRFIYLDKYALLIAELMSMSIFLLNYIKVGLHNSVLSTTMFIIVLLLIVPAFKSAKIVLRYGNVRGRIKLIAKIILETLQYIDVVETEGIKVNSEELNKYLVSCSLYGATSYEKTVFNDCLKQFFNPIDNPRYLLIRKSMFGILKRKDYHAIPGIIGINKKGAEFFCDRWHKKIGSCDLIYTRNFKGRQILLKSRTNSLSYSLLSKTEKKRIWKNKWH
ncbi:DEAD/DEAH box helicase family protein [Mycoplasmatota bacterium]|nr:DEAD/DEAH box helicase family protein [Mycoplasmatota bacterium]